MLLSAVLEKDDKAWGILIVKNDYQHIFWEKILSADRKYPCKDLIKRIQKLNDGEKISADETDDLRIQLRLFPKCKKYLNEAGLKNVF